MTNFLEKKDLFINHYISNNAEFGIYDKLPRNPEIKTLMMPCISDFWKSDDMIRDSIELMILNYYKKIIDMTEHHPIEYTRPPIEYIRLKLERFLDRRIRVISSIANDYNLRNLT